MGKIAIPDFVVVDFSQAPFVGILILEADHCSLVEPSCSTTLKTNRPTFVDAKKIAYNPGSSVESDASIGGIVSTFWGFAPRTALCQ